MADSSKWDGGSESNLFRKDSNDRDRRDRHDRGHERSRHRHRHDRDDDGLRDSDGRRHRKRSRSRERGRDRRRHNSKSRDGRERSRSFEREKRRGIDGTDGNGGGMSRNEEDRLKRCDERERDRRAQDSDLDGNEQKSGGSQSESSGNKRIYGRDWKDKLTSIREAHFNRNKQVSLLAQNQFRNDGSFLEMFKQKMAQGSTQQGEKQSAVTPNSLVLASSSIPFGPGLSLPPLTPSSFDAEQPSSSSVTEDVDGTPILKPLPMPVSVGKRRLAKPLKTGVVLKKPQKSEEDEGSQEKLDAWARYLQEVQKYKTANCIDEDTSRPLVK